MSPIDMSFFLISAGISLIEFTNQNMSAGAAWLLVAFLIYDSYE